MYLIPLIIFCFVAVLVLLIPYYKKAVMTEQRKPDISVYTEQLKELENNFKLDLLSEVEAKRSRIEIERRILSAASNEEGVIIEEAPNSFGITCCRKSARWFAQHIEDLALSESRESGKTNK